MNTKISTAENAALFYAISAIFQKGDDTTVKRFVEGKEVREDGIQVLKEMR